MKILVVVLALCGAMAAQTVYYNHPKGVIIGPAFKIPPPPTAKLTLPAGTYHAIFKSEFDAYDQSNYTGGQVECFLQGTGIPNVTNPYTLDVQNIDVPNPPEQPTGLLVMEAAFTTTGGTLTAQCGSPTESALQSARTSLSATKITSLVRQ